MKAFLFKTLLFFTILFCIDRGVGLLFSYLNSHSKGGETERFFSICNNIDADILVFGSSRAIHHYNPLIIQDSLGGSCYNCGESGNGIVLFYGIWELIRERYNPKVVIYDVNPDYDLVVGENNQKYLGQLKPYYDRKGVSQLFYEVSSEEKYKMCSYMYRYNTKFLSILADYLHPFSANIKGFIPIKNEMDLMKTTNEGKEYHPKIVFDSLKVHYFEEMMRNSKETQWVFVASPYWYGRDSLWYKPIIDMSKKYGVPFIDYSRDKKYVHNNAFFSDGSHLNELGANEFTSDLMNRISRLELVNIK